MDYDLAIAYRICPKISNESAMYHNNKLKLAEFCLRSLVKSLGALNPKVYVLLDRCPPEFDALFSRYFPEKSLEFIRAPGIGNQKTFKLQLKILLEQNHSEYVYFAEDDYFYLPGQFHFMLDFMHQRKDVDFVTPYDHLDYYAGAGWHDHPRQLTVSGGKHWVTVSSTCLTFLTKKSVLNETKEVFNTYSLGGTSEGHCWLSLTKEKLGDFAARDNGSLASTLINTTMPDSYSDTALMVANAWRFCAKQILFGRKYKLWSPLPTIATHMEKRFLSPVIDWQNVFKENLLED